MAVRNRSISKSGSRALTPPERSGHRHRQCDALCGGAAGPGRRTGAAVRQLYGRPARTGRLAAGCGVDTVAMESTGVYWIALYELLDSRGFDVLLVNARHVKNVSGRKSDVLDCQWLQQFTASACCAVRSGLPIRCASCARSPPARHAAAQPGALRAAHAKGTHADEHPTGQRDRRRGRRDGQKIVRAIVAGERDTQTLGAMRTCA